MALSFIAACRNNMLDEITALIDAGSGAGKLRIYDGVRPGNCGTATNLLAEMDMADPSAPAASAGVLTFDCDPDLEEASAPYAGTNTATWFRVVDSDNNCVIDGDVGTSGSDLNLTSTSITQTDVVKVTDFTITAGNAGT